MRLIATTTTLILFILLSSSHAAYGASCNTTRCGVNDTCCDEAAGAKCFDPTSYSCLPLENGSNLLCGNIAWYPTKACGDSTCYDEYEHSCCNGKLYNIHNRKGNPCVTPPGSIPPGCASCNEASACCVDKHHGALCYTVGEYLCHNDSVLCAMHDGVPELVCGSTCYSANTHTCCNGMLYGKDNRNQPCAPRAGNLTLEGAWDSLVSLASSGFSSPGGTACSWIAASNHSQSAFELYNCSQWVGAGSFRFNEASYLVSFPLPLTSASYARFELEVYVDNSKGLTQKAAISVFDNYISNDFYVSNFTIYTFPCNTLKLFAPPLHNIMIDIEAGFTGYKTIDVSNLATWSFASNPVDNIQLLFSSFNSCSCYYDSCYPEGCSCTSPDYRFTVGSKQSTHPPKLILDPAF